MPHLHVLSCARHWLHVFALNSDWFIALFAPVVIGQSIITLVLVLQHSTENHSIEQCNLSLTFDKSN